MRKIITSNSQIEFQEVNSTGTLLNSIGLQLGEVYFIIKGNKVSFYLNDSEKPFDSFIWSIDIPFYLDDTLIDNPNDASAALKAIMNDSFQEQLDALQEELATEEGRAQAAEEALDGKIDDEIARAVSAETQLQGEITSMSATVATFDSRITRNTNDISALTNTVNDEIARSVAKDAEHDAQISGLTNTLNSEIQRALSAETNLHNEIINEQNRAIAKENQIDAKLDNEINRSTEKDASHDAEISALTVSLDNEIQRATEAENSLRTDLNAEIANRISGDTNLQSQLNAEIARAQNAEEDLDDKIDGEISRANSEETRIEGLLVNEINRSTAKDASHDSLISGLTTSLQNEIQRAQNVENSLRNDLNTETSARTAADTAQIERIVALEVGKADKSDLNNYYTKVESDAKYATKDYVSGITENFYSKGQTDELLAAKADKAAAVASVEYVSSTKKINFKNIDDAIISEVDATAFIKDGMVDDVKIENDNLVITFNTDSGKEPISIPLSDIFNPENYYTKTEVDASQNAQNSKINEISGKTDNVITDVQTLSGDVQTISGSAITSGEVQTMIDNSISGKADTLTAGRAIDITNNVVSFTLPISAGTGENSVVEGYNTKTYGNYCHAEGRGSTAGKSGSNNGYSSHAEGEGTLAEGNMSHSEGNHTQASGNASHAEGDYTHTYGVSSHAEGSNTNAYNDYEHASGRYNKSTKLNSTYGSGGNTLFSVGNGVRNTSLHNTFEVKQNGDIYIADTSQITGSGSGETEGHNFYDVPMIKLQDALGQGGGGVTSGQVQTMIDESISGKTNQSDFTAHTANTTVHVTASEKSTWNNKSDFSGSYNDLTNKPTIPNYSAGDGIDITNNVISTVTKFWCGTQQQYDAISVKDPNTVYMIHE